MAEKSQTRHPSINITYSTSMIEQLIETWQINNRINRYLLEAIPAEALPDKAGGKGRSVGEQFAHLHKTRLMWLKVAAPELLASQPTLEEEASGNPAALAEALEASAHAISEMVRTALELGKNVKGFKPHPTAFIGYLIAHESHHRGQIALTLKTNGHPLDKKTSYGMWEWGVR